MDANARPARLGQTLNERARRVLLAIGLGFLAAVSGAAVAAKLAIGLQPVLAELPRWVAIPIGVAIARLWILAALPAIGYFAGRVLGLSPVALAVGAGITGELFYAAIDVVTGGFASLYANVPLLGVRLVTLAAGLWLTSRATQAGRTASARASDAARRRAEAQKEEYADILREAERTAARGETAGAPPPPEPDSAGGPPPPRTDG